MSFLVEVDYDKLEEVKTAMKRESTKIGDLRGESEKTFYYDVLTGDNAEAAEWTNALALRASSPLRS